MSHTHTARLMRVFNTSEADLAANRNGEITRAQHERLKPTQSQTIVQIALWGHLLGIGGLMLFVTLITQQLILLLVCGVVIGLGIMPFTMLRSTAADVRLDLADGTLASATGSVSVTRSQKRDSAYRLKLHGADLSFVVTRKQASAFSSEVPYTIYYLPKSRAIVSAEVLEASPAD